MLNGMQRKEEKELDNIELKRKERERREKAGEQQEFVDPSMAETLADATAGTLNDRIQ